MKKARRYIQRRLSTKRFSGEDMARFARYLTNMSRYSSISKLEEWFDGPPESGRPITIWKDK